VLDLYAIETVPDIVYVVYTAVYYLAEVIAILTSKPLRDSALTDVGFFCLFSVCNFLSAIFFLFFVNETMGLNDLQKKALYS